MFFLVFAGLLGYLLGSIPTAYLLVRWQSKLDIRAMGSGNVGTLNSYEVTGSKTTGLVVLIVDFLKGAAAVLIVRGISDGGFGSEACAGFGALVGHNFPMWLGFRGGRGLATGAGVMAVFCWIVVAFWLGAWGIGFLLSRRVNPANAAASALTLFALLAASEELLVGVIGKSIPLAEFRLFAFAAFSLILLKHLKPIREYIMEKRQGNRPPDAKSEENSK